MNHLSSLIRLVFLPIVLVACNSKAEKPQENKYQAGGQATGIAKN